MPGHAVREDEGAIAAHEAGIAVHDFQARAHVRRKVFLVDDQNVGMAHARAALARNLVPGGHVDDVDDEVGQRRAERQRKIVAAAKLVLQSQRVDYRHNAVKTGDAILAVCLAETRD